MDHDAFLDTSPAKTQTIDHEDFLNAPVDPAPAPAPTSRRASTDGLLGIEARQLLENAPAIGGMIGGTLGATVGAAAAGVGAAPSGVMGAALGGMTGKTAQKLYSYLSGERDPSRDSALGNAGDIAGQGLIQAFFDATGHSISYLSELGAPYLAKVGAQIIKATSGIPEKYGEAVLRNPKILNSALNSQEMSAAYKSFEGYTGLKGLGKTLVDEGRAHLPPSEAEKIVVGTAKRVMAAQAARKAVIDSGAMVAKGAASAAEATMPSAQDLYTASQAASHLKLMSKYGEPSAQAMITSGIIGQGKQVVDDSLQEIYPEYRNLRVANFNSKAREAFSAILPQNKNFTPSVLRTGAALSAAGYEAEHGNYGKAAMALSAVSPAVTGLGIRAASGGLPIIVRGAGIAARVEAQNIADKIGAKPDPSTLSPDAQKVLGAPL